MRYLVYSVLTLFLVLLVGCGVFVNDDKVKTAVEKQGYREVKIVSSHIFFVSWRGCSKSDDAAYKIKAVNSSTGNKVDLIACAGWPFKGVTIRTKG